MESILDFILRTSLQTCIHIIGHGIDSCNPIAYDYVNIRSACIVYGKKARVNFMRRSVLLEYACPF